MFFLTPKPLGKFSPLKVSLNHSIISKASEKSIPHDVKLKNLKKQGNFSPQSCNIAFNMYSFISRSKSGSNIL
ncbi:hypothetical protein [Sulfolobus ellipsoid virus 1]|uniref:Uncharacterized protein n=1 Tax=Sulfolobus ellipsoid virus 1 TaxID=2056194 RepID=A0A2H4RBQ8_9VIRU|nr:hypothetical protein FGG62_gp38 [Sulfolobus ellipsoid virus 1]ATY46516.1 hypothetical protein [Sulfolobus ellipsoid virus 1]